MSIDVNERIDGYTALFLAAERGDRVSVARLLAAGADPCLTNSLDQRTPLHYALRLDILSLLVSHGANVNAVDEDNWTPLCYQVMGDRASSVDFLCFKGAKPNVAGYVLTVLRCFRPLMIVFRCFIRYEPILVAAQLPSSAVLESLYAVEVDDNVTDQDGRSPLMLAANRSRIDIVRLLLSLNVDTRKPDKRGFTIDQMVAPNTPIQRLLVEHSVKSVTALMLLAFG